MDTFVAIDIETTGLDPDRDQIIELGAVRVEGGRLTDTFSQLVEPTIAVPLWSQRITGIRPADLAGKPDVTTAMKSFRVFVGDTPLVAHNAAFEHSFLTRHPEGGFAEELYDSLLLARIVLPGLPRHNLETLIRHFALADSEQHRGLDDAQMAARVWLKLMKQLQDLPPAVLSQMAWIISRTTDPLQQIIVAAAEAARPPHPTAAPQIESILKDFSELLGRRQPKRAAASEPAPLDGDAVVALLEPDHALASALPNYRPRPEQLQMARQVTEAINAHHILAVEAGTGTGKSMAYLIPAALWARQNDQKVVISTNTKNLQEQLVSKDIPLLEKTLGHPVHYAIAKGRANYLCVLKLFQFLHELRDETIEDDALDILPLLPWAAQTESGDISENGSFYMFRSRRVWERLYSIGEDCAGRNCAYYNNCFLMKARQAVAAAQIIVANHSVVFADIATGGALLPDYGTVVFDEAHNIENVATEHMRVAVGRLRVVRILARLYRPSRKPHGSGLLPQVLNDLDAAHTAAKPAWHQDAMDRCVGAIDYAKKLTTDMDHLNTCLASLFPTGGKENRIRYQKDGRSAQHWEPVRQAAKRIIAAIGGITSGIGFLTEKLAELDKGQLPFRTERIKDLEGQAGQLSQISGDLQMLVDAEQEQYVYWAERQSSRRRAAAHLLCAAPLDVSAMMKTELYDKKAAIIMTSATLSVKKSFDFLLGRLGLNSLPDGRVKTAILGSSFDFASQALVTLANFLPEPTQAAEFEPALAQLLAKVHRTTGGRGLVLFTSYRMLRNVYTQLKPVLEREGILVLAQGIDGSRRALTEVFRNDISSVLLGTSSFWEGVDVVGESLSCLTLVRLPFGVVSDPVTAARCEFLQQQGKDPFIRYSVPNAVIRFRQGFGRLIRSRSDRGVVLITDRRAKTKRYGSAFLQSLPVEPTPYPNSEQLLGAIGTFLGNPEK